MSALSGILYEDSRPVSPQLAMRLGMLNRERGRGSATRHAAPGILLQHYALHFDRYSRLERQPHVLSDGSVLTWDGRLDNRLDLSMRLRGTVSPDATDVEIVAAALERWGFSANEHCIGDWSYALWNPTRNTLSLARDYAGNRPLFYTQQQHCVAWSTCLETLVALFDAYDDLDDIYMAGLLSFGPPPWITPFRGIQAVPAGHVLEFPRERAMARRRFWNLPLGQIRYAQPASYAEHYRELLTEAVSVRLRASGPVWSELSGGYDSSAIVCLADWLVRNRRVDAPDLMLTSDVFSKSLESDESQYIAAVERHCGRTSIRRDATEQERTLESFNRGLLPLNSAATWSHAMALARASGSHVLLSGELGDLITGKNSENCVSLFERLRQLRLLWFVTGCFEASLRLQQPMLEVMGRVFGGALPPGLLDERHAARALGAAAAAHRVAASDVVTVFLLNREFAQRTQPAMRRFKDDLRGVPVEKRPLVRGLVVWSSSGVLTTPDALPDLRLTFPYSHRPLVELVLAIPQSVLWTPTTIRPLVKQALAGVVPDAVLQRNSKGYSPPATSRFYRPMALALLRRQDSLQLVERGYIDRKGFVALLDAFVNGKIVVAGHLAKLISIEAWFQHGRQRVESHLEAVGVG